MSDVPITNSEIRKIAHDTRTTRPASGGIVQKRLMFCRKFDIKEGYKWIKEM